ncbi:MAG: peptidoglycan-binding protein [Salibacteraceae bacterium]
MSNPTLRERDGFNSQRPELRPDVKRMQEALTRHGYNTDTDGYFGSGTLQEVKKFQTQHQLGADGVVGPATWKALLADGSAANDGGASDNSKGSEPLTGDVLITREQLAEILSTSEYIDTYYQALNDALKKFQINTPLRIVHFIAQVAHESGSFRFVVENLNYSASALRSVFGKYFPDDATAEAYARQPEKIANRVYGNRMGNGDEASGDGWRFRGRGLIQLTGRDNYTAFQKSMGQDLTSGENSAKVAQPELAVAAAGWFWDMRNLNQYADADDILTITKRINGGTNGLDDRKKYLAKGKQAFGL